MLATVNRKERENASTAETTPLDRAVNIPLAKTFSPTNNNAREQERLPVTASAWTGLSGRAKMPTRGTVARIETTVQRTEAPMINRMLKPTSFFSFSWSYSP